MPGQGIPDPCLIHPYLEKPDVIPGQELICCQKFYRAQNNRNCLCCEKKYLFECPDKHGRKFKNQNLNCTCSNCHLDVAEESSESSETHPVVHFHENADLDLTKPSEGIKKKVTTQDVACQVNPELNVEASRNYDGEKKGSLEHDTKSVKAIPTDVSNYETKITYSNEPTDKTKQEFPKHRSNHRKNHTCCSCFTVTKNESDEILRKVEPINPNVSSPEPETKQRISEQTQTDFKSPKVSISIQTDENKTVSKSPRKCECRLKCFMCDAFRPKSGDFFCPKSFQTCIGNSLRLLEKCPYINRHLQSNHLYVRTCNVLKKLHDIKESDIKVAWEKPHTSQLEKNNSKRTRN